MTITETQWVLICLNDVPYMWMHAGEVQSAWMHADTRTGQPFTFPTREDAIAAAVTWRSGRNRGEIGEGLNVFAASRTIVTELISADEHLLHMSKTTERRDP